MSFDDDDIIIDDENNADEEKEEDVLLVGNVWDAGWISNKSNCVLDRFSSLEGSFGLAVLVLIELGKTKQSTIVVE